MDNIMLELKPTDIVFVYCTDYYYKNGFILTDDDFHDIDYRTFGNWHFNFTNSSYNIRLEYLYYLSGFSTVEDVSEVSEIDGIKYYKMSFSPLLIC